MATDTTSTPRPASSMSKLTKFLKNVPPNSQRTGRQPNDNASSVRNDNASSVRNDDETSNGVPFESPKCLMANLDSESNASSFFEDGIPFSVATPQQIQDLPTNDSSTDDEADDYGCIDRLKDDIHECIDSIKQAIMHLTPKDTLAAQTMLDVLLDIQAKATTIASPRSHIPHFLGAALKSFDKTSLSLVDDTEKPYHSVSVQHVEQAMKIRAFRKQELPQVFPRISDHPLGVLGDLFPDILMDTIVQMFDACARDLQSCFEVLSGLSASLIGILLPVEYTDLEGSFSPISSSLKTDSDKDYKKSFVCKIDTVVDDKVDPPLSVAVQGNTKTTDLDPASSPSPSSLTHQPAHIDDSHGTYFTLPPFEAPLYDATASMKLPFGDDASAAQLFARFESGQNMPDILSAWRDFKIDPMLHHNQVYAHVKSIFQPHISFRQVRIFDILDKKQHNHRLYTEKAAATKRVCVVGGGPVGLRTAIELALMGAQVVVVEKRSTFDRENIVHLFPWVVHDLTLLGAKFFFNQFCVSMSHLHIGTRQLQCILLKTALLLGVTVFDNMSFDSLSSNVDDGYRIHTTPSLPETLQRVSALVAGGGGHDTIGDLVGIKRASFSPSPAVGAVAIVPNLLTKAERLLPQFSWAYQYNQELFGRLKRELGVDVENVVYYRGEVHYVVMTPKKASLIDAGVLATKELSSVNAEALQRYVKSVLTFFNIPCPDVDVDAKLFDFSQTRRADKAAVVMPHATSKLFVALVGDALLEPFWPQGLGINRGFHSALDAAFAISRLGQTEEAMILADHDKNYKRCARQQVQKNIHTYTVDPASRYHSL
ncbi:Aste57867_19161 [Aphanomyces stellatus]|uniref:Aste57867_19161 protein n=1 Tax=Aphanomyces stellatus TaxID=120398 RepID=A0A485LCJ6_9STRA|nr:hypothetical protein As57867_019097 [Aphanomyces stellatus]VFT95883.1 Aste57867_19161 [Aphanomyces stellatus]